jgi:hypothetical protein
MVWTNDTSFNSISARVLVEALTNAVAVLEALGG